MISEVFPIDFDPLQCLIAIHWVRTKIIRKLALLLRISLKDHRNTFHSLHRRFMSNSAFAASISASIFKLFIGYIELSFGLILVSFWCPLDPSSKREPKWCQNCCHTSNVLVIGGRAAEGRAGKGWLCWTVLVGMCLAGGQRPP